MAKDPARAIKSAIIQSKKITLNYGYCLGIDPWEAVWVTHKKVRQILDRLRSDHSTDWNGNRDE